MQTCKFCKVLPSHSSCKSEDPLVTSIWGAPDGRLNAKIGHKNDELYKVCDGQLSVFLIASCMNLFGDNPSIGGPC